MNRVVFRRAVPADCPDVQRMIVALAAEGGHTRIPKISAPALEHFAFGLSPRLLVWIAQLDEVTVGTLVGTPIVSTWRGCEGIYVVDLYVEPWARGWGIASSLLGRALRDGGYQFVKLEVAGRNETAIRFYQKRGFVPVDGDHTMFLEPSALPRFLACY